MLSSQVSVFDERGVAKVLCRYRFRHLMARILQSLALRRIEVRAWRSRSERGGRRYTRRKLSSMGTVGDLAVGPAHGVPEKVLEGVFSRYHRLSAEQRRAIERVAKAGRINAVVGRAGAARLKAARPGSSPATAWSAQHLPARRPRGSRRKRASRAARRRHGSCAGKRAGTRSRPGPSRPRRPAWSPRSRWDCSSKPRSMPAPSWCWSIPSSSRCFTTLCKRRFPVV